MSFPSITVLQAHVPDVSNYVLIAILFTFVIAGIYIITFVLSDLFKTYKKTFLSYSWFIYANFLKPHTGDLTGGQQEALESFYKAQANVYDLTRAWLLRGREEMLALMASQLRFQSRKETLAHTRPIWVDIGGGTGWNIEAMASFVDVPSFFSEIHLVDYSPSLCEVARKRFARLGWENVHIVCQDARLFTLSKGTKADLVTMSYSLSMLPNFHVFIDAAASLLDPNGIIGVVDFYVQNVVETTGRNYLGGCLQRHVNWIGRTFWRAWFDLDRVGLEGARRDYLEYRFGTLKSVDERNYILGGYSGICIPYYIFLGRLVSSTAIRGDIERLDAACTESPYLAPRSFSLDENIESDLESRSKAYKSAIINLSANLPLPSTFYQNFQYRIYYEETLPKHTQFGNDFIYAFTWEDSRIDLRLLNIDSNSVILCLTSAGDNLLDYLYSSHPRRIHAVDLNPNQSHLLELKVASYQALDYVDFWKLFGEGRHENFHRLLLDKISPYMSSQGLQYWLNREYIFDSTGSGLYGYGGSGQATRLVRLLTRFAGLEKAVREFCAAKTMNEQQEKWPRLRRVLLNRFLHWTFIGSDFLWRAAGVPKEQAALITKDFRDRDSVDLTQVSHHDNAGEAIWQYVCDTLDPVVKNTLVSEENFYYLLTLMGRYTRRCHPNYLSAKAHAKLSRPGAFDGLRIHTDEIKEVIARLRPGTLTIAVIMDSMDWFDPESQDAVTQVVAINKALKFGGRVLLRSAGLTPWYISTFENNGFSSKRVAARIPGSCIDRVNMYASTWILVKITELSNARASSAAALEKLVI